MPSPALQSLIVAYRCKLELWDDDSGLEDGSQPDLVIDQTSRLNLGKNKYVDSLADEDEYEDMDEKISAYRFVQFYRSANQILYLHRCTCRESTFGKK